MEYIERVKMTHNMLKHLSEKYPARARRGRVDSSALIKVPGLLCDQEFDGVPLSKYMLPEETLEAKEVNDIFTAIAFRELSSEEIQSGIDGGSRGLARGREFPRIYGRLPEGARKYVNKDLARYLVYAGHQPGWSLEIAEDTLMAVHESYEIGVFKGKIFCEYKDSLPTRDYPINTSFLWESKKKISYDPSLILLNIRTCLAADEEAKRLVGAMVVANVTMPGGTSPVLKEFTNQKYIDKRNKQILEILHSGPDPFNQIEGLLVPGVLPAKIYNTIVGIPSKRSHNPSLDVREKVYLALQDLGIIE